MAIYYGTIKEPKRAFLIQRLSAVNFTSINLEQASNYIPQGHAVAVFVKALCYKLEARGSIPNEIIVFFN
jgi:hypothetical protein